MKGAQALGCCCAARGDAQALIDSCRGDSDEEKALSGTTLPLAKTGRGYTWWSLSFQWRTLELWASSKWTSSPLGL